MYLFKTVILGQSVILSTFVNLHSKGGGGGENAGSRAPGLKAESSITLQHINSLTWTWASAKSCLLWRRSRSRTGPGPWAEHTQWPGRALTSAEAAWADFGTLEWGKRGQAREPHESHSLNGVCSLPSMALLSAEQRDSLWVGSSCWPTGQFHGSEYASRLNASYTYRVDRHTRPISIQMLLFGSRSTLFSHTLPSLYMCVYTCNIFLCVAFLPYSRHSCSLSICSSRPNWIILSVAAWFPPHSCLPLLQLSSAGNRHAQLK